MALPFTAEQFFQVFARYNAAIWPAQWAAYGLGVLAVAALVSGGRRSARVVLGVLAVFWAVAGGGYHLVFFRRINPIAAAFGILFLVEAVLLAHAALSPNPPRFRLARTPRALLGAAIAAYAMLVYPALNLAAGHGLVESPAFGVTPCPVTIFTLGVFVVAEERVAVRLLVIPVVWACLGLVAATALGVVADFGLAVAAVAAVAAHVAPPHARTPPAALPG